MNMGAQEQCLRWKGNPKGLSSSLTLEIQTGCQHWLEKVQWHKTEDTHRPTEGRKKQSIIYLSIYLLFIKNQAFSKVKTQEEKSRNQQLLLLSLFFGIQSGLAGEPETKISMDYWALLSRVGFLSQCQSIHRFENSKCPDSRVHFKRILKEREASLHI